MIDWRDIWDCEKKLKKTSYGEFKTDAWFLKMCWPPDMYKPLFKAILDVLHIEIYTQRPQYLGIHTPNQSYLSEKHIIAG